MLIAANLKAQSPTKVYLLTSREELSLSAAENFILLQLLRIKAGKIHIYRCWQNYIYLTHIFADMD